LETALRKINFQKEVTLIPVGDLHLSSRACAERHIDRLIQYIMKKEDCYMIGVGDYSDLIIRQDIKRFMGSCGKRELNDVLDSALNEQRNIVIKKFKPLADAGKILGLGEGNHEYDIKKYHSFDVMQDICSALKVPYLGTSYFYKLILKRKKGSTCRNVVIWGHHGFGQGGYTIGGAINKRARMFQHYDADIIIMGHDHQKFGTRMIRLGIDDANPPNIIHKPVIVGATGSYLKTAIKGDTTYSERKGYPPTDLGVIKITISFEGHDAKLAMHVSE
jgi:UDP-2,3-diacylglucosamine pyrophosphatase LpxH